MRRPRRDSDAPAQVSCLGLGVLGQHEKGGSLLLQLSRRHKREKPNRAYLFLRAAAETLGELRTRTRLAVMRAGELARRAAQKSFR